MSTLIACDFKGCQATKCVEWPTNDKPYYEQNGWLSLGTDTPFQLKSGPDTVPTHRFMLCPEHVKAFSDNQWLDKATPRPTSTGASE